MNKQEFAEKIKDILIQRLGSSYRIFIQQLDHLNQPEEVSIFIGHGINPVGSSIRMSSLYKKYCDFSCTLEQVADEMEGLSWEGEKNKPEMELLNDVFEYEKAKAHLFLRVVNTDRNRKLLENIPSVECLDLSVVFCLLLIKHPEQIGSVTITNAMMEGWNISIEELYRNALENGQNLFPPKIAALKDIFQDFLEDGPDAELGISDGPDAEGNWKDFMTVVTNKAGINGAGAILYPDILDDLRERLGGDFYILPSSIHEVIVIPADESIKPEELKEMVLEVNETMVREEERLSGHVYFYSSGKLELTA